MEILLLGDVHEDINEVKRIQLDGSFNAKL